MVAEQKKENNNYILTNLADAVVNANGYKSYSPFLSNAAW